MGLAPGTRLGTYEITGTLGAGGMGEVCRALDTRLGREAAIKTLPTALAGDRERLARFEREAQLLAALNHAHIASVYGLGEHEGMLYLAMELVEGETLEAALRRGSLPVEDALRLALQITEALEAAHDKGVVHRDLKPANIMLSRHTQVKVLDFGLAKAFAGPAGEGRPAHSPALSLAMTQQGLVLGTAGYMSPEQASGQATDQRADIWAFGVVLYEMLTGVPLFRGESVPHIIADVLKTEPDWSRLPRDLHPRIRHLLERCLTKRARSRLHSIADARIEIEAALADPDNAQGHAKGLAASPARARWAPLAVTAAIAAMATATVAAVAGSYWRQDSGAGPVARFSIPIPAGTVFQSDPVSSIALSPDGTRIAYVADGGVYLRNLAETEARTVPGTAEPGLTPLTPAFSPDGQWLAYVAAVTQLGPYFMKRVPVSGGAPRTVYEAAALPEFPHGLSWPAADTLLFANEQGVVRIPANGGPVEVLVPRAEDERFYSPQILPGGDAVLFTRVPRNVGLIAGGYESAEVVAQSIGKDDRRVVWEGGAAARYLPTGHLVYAQDTTLSAIAFDPQALTVRGGPVPVVEGLRRSSSGDSDTGNFAISDTGTLVQMPGAPDGSAIDRIRTTLSWIDREGREQALPVRADDYTMLRISPDGTKVALVVGAALGRDLPPAIWIYDFASETLQLLATDPVNHDSPVWSADSSRLYVRAGRADLGSLTVQAIDLATGQVTLLAEPSDRYPFPTPWALSPDGRTLALINALNLNDVDLATLSLADGALAPLLTGPGMQNEPSFSPAGPWIAVSEQLEGGVSEIYIVPFPAVTRTRFPVGVGESPIFSSDGSELYFFDGEGISAVPITYSPTLKVGQPKPLFAVPGILWSNYGRSWDADATGERFLTIRDPAGNTETSGRQIDVVVNWFDELRQRVPVP